MRGATASAEALLDATSSLLSERTDLEVSLYDISGRSGLNSALIRYYFGNKEGLLLALLERHARCEMTAMQHLASMALRADQKLKLHIGGIINAYARFPYLNRLIYYMLERGTEASRQKVVDIFITPMIAVYDAIVCQGMKEGTFRKVDTLLLYHSIVGGCEHIFSTRLSEGSVGHGAGVTEELKRRYIDHMCQMVLTGLLEPGVKLPERSA